ncbi:MAG: hypothetical protein V9E81_10060 [Marmoricola sp.]
MLKRLGFPTIGEHRRFVVALAIDAIGSGVWMPFELLFFVRVTDLPLSHIGAAMSAGALFGIPVSMLMGSVVDRFGPKPAAGWPTHHGCNLCAEHDRDRRRWSVGGRVGVCGGHQFVLGSIRAVGDRDFRAR